MAKSAAPRERTSATTTTISMQCDHAVDAPSPPRAQSHHMTGTSIRRTRDCSDNVEGGSGPYLYCSARFDVFRFSSSGPSGAQNL